LGSVRAPTWSGSKRIDITDWMIGTREGFEA
jgi:hypothetical protein